MKSENGDITTAYTKAGLKRFQLEIKHEGLHKYQIIKGDNQYVVQQKARYLMHKWDQAWENKKSRQDQALRIQEKKDIALEKTNQAQEVIKELENLLPDALPINNKLDWEMLKDKSSYPVSKPPIPKVPSKPEKTDQQYQPKLSLLEHIIASRSEKKRAEIEQSFLSDLHQWKDAMSKAKKEYESKFSEWKDGFDEFQEKQKAANEAIEATKQAYLKNKAPQAILDYYDAVLAASNYPDYFPQSWEIDYQPNTKLILLDYQLPDISELHTLKEIRFIKSRDEFSEKHVSQLQLNILYRTVGIVKNNQ